MKKWISAALCLALFLIILPVASRAATIGSLNAAIDKDKQVSISGTVSSGAGQTVTVKVTDPSGKVDYVNSTVSLTGGEFGFNYLMTNTAAGTYGVSLSSPGVSGVVTTEFSYGDDCSLSALSISGGELDKAFSPDTTDYSVTVAYAISGFTVTPVASDSTASVSVNGAKLTGSTSSSSVKLEIGVNTISIKVAALSGKTKTYTVKVTRQEKTNIAVTADVSVGSDGQVTISGNVSSGAGQKVTAYVTGAKGAVIFIGETVSLLGGNFKFTFTLSGADTGKYTALIGALGASKPLTVGFEYTEGLELNGLSLSSGSLSPGFKPGVTSYTAIVGYKTGSITLTPAAGKGCASIKVNTTTVTGGSASPAISLVTGNNVITVTALSKDGQISKAYTVTVTRQDDPRAGSFLKASAGSGSAITISGAAGKEAGRQISVMVLDPNNTIDYLTSAETGARGAYEITYTTANKAVGKYKVYASSTAFTEPLETYFVYGPAADLKSLSVSGKAITPGFSPDITSYYAEVAYGVDSVSVTAMAKYPGASIKVNGKALAGGSRDIQLNVGANTVTVLVDYLDGALTKSYTISIVRMDPPKSGNADLSGLTISSGSLAFSPSETNYTVSVDSGVQSVTVTPTASFPVSAVRVNGTNVASGTESGTISLSTGSNVITITVTAEGGTEKTYSITVTKGKVPRSNNANLSNLTINPGSLTFTSSTTYAVSVPYTVASVTVTPTVSDSKSTVKVNGTTVTSGSASGSITLNTGANTITVIVKAEDGTEKTYSITVNKGASPSNNANLSNLTISQGSLTFSSATTSYSVDVAYSVASISVTPTVSDTKSTVKVNGTSVTSGSASGSITLNTGANTITVIVKAEDGTEKTYTVTVTKGAPLSNNANLSNLTISQGSLTFSSTTTSYSVDVAYSVTSISVTPTVSDAKSTVKVNGTAVASGSASGSITLNTGVNTITVTVKAEDGTEKTYTIAVTKGAPLSSNTNLSNLTISQGNLTFSSATTNYSVDVAYSVASISVTPTVSDAKSTVKVNGTAVTSGSASGSITLDTGANTVTVIVKAEDGTEKTYTITVNRSAPSNNANLSSLSIDQGILDITFDPNTVNYTLTVSGTVTTINVTAYTDDSNATVSVNLGSSVAGGKPQSVTDFGNGILIKVTAEDGTFKYYSITVNRIS